MRLLLIGLFTILLPSYLLGQNDYSIEGRIQDKKGKPIPTALVSIKDSTIGTYSDEDGKYFLKTKKEQNTIIVSTLGYKTKQIPISFPKNTFHLTQNFALEEDAVELASVEVKGKTQNQQLRESSYTVNALDVTSKINSLNNLNELIGRSSGIRIREDGGVGADYDLSINGLSGNSVRYFIDGVPLASFGNGVSLSNLPVNLVDRIEIYKGVVPSSLGTDALGGVINVISKKGISNYLDASYGMGSFNTYKGDINALYTDSKTGIFIRPTFGVNYSKNNYKMKGVEVWNKVDSKFEEVNVKRFHDDYLSFLGQLNIGVKNKKWADLLDVTGSFSSVDKELQTGSIQSIVYGKAKRKNESYAIATQYQKDEFLTKNLSANASLSYTWDNSTVIDTVYRKYSWDGTYIESSRNEITGRAKSLRHIKRPLLVGRTNFNYLINENHSFNFNYLIESVSNKRTDDVDKDFVPSKDTFSKQILGLSYNQNFWGNKWINSFFAKEYLSHLKIGQEDIPSITGSNNVKRSSNTNHWGGGVSSRYIFFNWLAVKASYEHSVRLPLSREYLGNGTTIYPNFKLNPENSNNYNLGLFGSLSITQNQHLFYEVGVFSRNVKDYIRLVVSESDGMSQYSNVNNVTVKGIEGEVKYTLDSFFEAIVNVSYLDEKNKTKYQANGKPDITYNNRMPNRPWVYGNLELNGKLKNVFGIKKNQLRLSYYMQYVHWFYLTWEGYGTLSSKSKIPTQYINNTELTYSLQNEKYNISFACNNLFDRLVYDNYKMQKPGRSFFCKLRIFLN